MVNAVPPSASAPPNAPSAPAQPSVGFNLLALATLIALAALALAYLIDAMADKGRQSPASGANTSRIETSLAGTTLSVPTAWLRVPGQHRAQFSDRLDLNLPLELAPNTPPVIIAATLLPKSKVRPSAQLLDQVYTHAFASTQLSGPIGLVGKPLTGDPGLAGEMVWYDPISIDPFVAKCAAGPGPETHCLRTIGLKGGIAIVLDFDAKLLPDWKAFDPALSRALKTIGAGAVN